jgi:hypothetical protein
MAKSSDKTTPPPGSRVHSISAIISATAGADYQCQCRDSATVCLRQRRSSSIVLTKHAYDPEAGSTSRAKVDAVEAMAWIWGYDPISEWDKLPTASADV